jgi:hypothetical protein
VLGADVGPEEAQFVSAEAGGVINVAFADEVGDVGVDRSL